MNTAIILGVIIVWTGCMIFAAWCLINLRAELDKKTDELAMEKATRRRIERESLALVEAVVPLIEQTDWMTGRWHGQFHTLQKLETERNIAVVTARRALWEISLVATHLKKNLTFGDRIVVSDHTKNYGADT